MRKNECVICACAITIVVFAGFVGAWSAFHGGGVVIRLRMVRRPAAFALLPLAMITATSPRFFTLAIILALSLRSFADADCARQISCFDCRFAMVSETFSSCFSQARWTLEILVVCILRRARNFHAQHRILIRITIAIVFRLQVLFLSGKGLGSCCWWWWWWWWLWKAGVTPTIAFV